MHTVTSLVLFLLPTKLARLLLHFNKNVRISPTAKIGFSWISASDIFIDGARVGHFNYLKINKIHIGGGKIGHLNFISGNFELNMQQSNIGNQNKFSSTGTSYHNVVLKLEERSHITTKHLFDLTDSIVIGKRTTLAGAGTQIWTHSFLRSKELNRNVRIDSPVFIGDWCYIGSRCNIMPGVRIADEITIGAQTVIAKTLNQSGIYIGQGVRFIDTDFKEKIMNLGKPIQGFNIYRK